ncbi:septin-2 isoform X2 [Anabrus simplex]
MLHVYMRRSPSPSPAPRCTASTMPSSYSTSLLSSRSHLPPFSTSYSTSFLSSAPGQSQQQPASTFTTSLLSSTMRTSQAQRPTHLLPPVSQQDTAPAPTGYCLSCPPAGLNFSAARTIKQASPAVAPPPQIDREYIGFATLPEQIHRKSVKRGFDFTLMVVGDSGLGKSTLLNSLFLSDLHKDRKIPDVSERVEKTACIEKKLLEFEERGVKLRLTIVDTPGFGDAVNCEENWAASCSYIDEQFRQFYNDETGLNRKNIQDNRVHCCLYFIPPFGHGLRQLDVELMRRLHRKVNIVPIIAKADTLTAQEVKRLKECVMADIEDHKIQIYQFPECDSDEDEEFQQQDRELKACIPFAVVGSNAIIEVEGRKVRARQYPWGVVEVENPEHSDFTKLRTMLISTHMQDLKDVTHDLHYENFRAQRISQISQQTSRERSKLRRDSMTHFEGSISDTERLLLQKDEEIRRMQDMLTQMQEKLHF